MKKRRMRAKIENIERNKISTQIIKKHAEKEARYDLY